MLCGGSLLEIRTWSYLGAKLPDTGKRDAGHGNISIQHGHDDPWK
jgi:hypothetical protein